MGNLRRMLVVGLGLVVVLLTARCFDPRYPEGVPCDVPDDCPPGQVCHGGACTRNPESACGQPEQCNGVDDDCDGAIDESGPGDSGVCDCLDGTEQPCANGTCPADGAQRCAAGTWGACLGATAPSPEQCDVGLVDENCDGVANEDCPCLNGMTRPCGQCGDGVQVCDLAGLWSTCSGGTPPGTCCPGQLQPCGNCGDGLQTCTAAGQWGTCAGATPTGPCCPGQTRSCGTSTGECSTGVESCTGNGTWSGACAGNQGPVAESCNGRDDDCDGSTDEITACTGCISIGTVLVFPMGSPIVGDTDFGGHGPAVTIDTRYRRSGAQVCADVTVRMRETAANWSEAVKTASRCAAAPGTVASVTTPNSTHGYTDTDQNDLDSVPVQQGTGISAIQCTGDTNGPDLCSDQAMPNCSGCQVTVNCVRATYQ